MSSPPLRPLRQRRHPLEVTSDRLADHYEKYYDRLSPSDRDQLSQLRYVLQSIAEEATGSER